MPQDLKDFPRPANDNGRGLHGSFDPAWNGGTQGYDYWVNLLTEMNVKWFKVLDDRGSSIPFCEKLLAAGIFPIVRILRRDPPPNDAPEPNPGHLSTPEEETIKRLVGIGVHYFETNNEPNLMREWKHNAIPGNSLEAAKLVALNWLFDARVILSCGGLPGLPAISNGGEMDLMGALVALGRQSILLDGCWIAIHNYAQNRPLNFPDDPVNRSGQSLTRAQYGIDPFTQWAWWNTAHNAPDSIDAINEQRANSANPAPNIAQDHACFREFEFYNALAMKYLGRSIPIIGTEGGYSIGRREDWRYPRVTPAMHRDQTVALFDFMQRQAPDYLFASTVSALVGTDDHTPEAWHSDFWHRAFQDAPFGFDGIPALTVPNANLDNELPVIQAVKAMQNLARRMPGAQPLPPVQPAMPMQVKPTREQIQEPVTAPRAPAPADFPFWLRDEPATVPPKPAEEKIAPPPPPPVEVKPVVPPVEAKPVTPTPAPIFAPPPPEQGVPMKSPMPQESFASVSNELPPLPEDLEWDWRLDALGVGVQTATVKPGQAYWKLVRAEYQGPGESNDQHQIFYRIVDQHDQPMEYQKVLQSWVDGQTDAITNESGETNIPIWASYAPDQDETGPYNAWVDGLPSDRVTGMGLPQKHHVCFRLTWKRSFGGYLTP